MLAVRWYLGVALSHRDAEELLAERDATRGGAVDLERPSRTQGRS